MKTLASSLFMDTVCLYNHDIAYSISLLLQKKTKKNSQSFNETVVVGSEGLQGLLVHLDMGHVLADGKELVVNAQLLVNWK